MGPSHSVCRCHLNLSTANAGGQDHLFVPGDGLQDHREWLSSPVAEAVTYKRGPPGERDRRGSGNPTCSRTRRGMSGAKAVQAWRNRATWVGDKP